MAGGASGFVGILENYYDDPYWYSEDYTDIGKPLGFEYMSLPALWISRSSGNELKEKFKSQGKLNGNLKLSSTYSYKKALNISGKLPGKSPDIILTHSHHDAVFAGAVQDASGISEMLALAKYFSQIPETDREKTMMFAATDTHYTDYNGHVEFIRQRRYNGENLILDLAIEHIGEETYFDDDYNEIKTGEAEARLVYITRQSGLYDDVVSAFKRNNLKQAVFYQVDLRDDLDAEYEFHEDEVISDAYYFNESGTPVVSMVSSEMYIFHPSDTPKRIPKNQLEPVGRAFAEIALAASEKL